MSTLQIVTGLGLVALLVVAFVLLDRMLARKERGEQVLGGDQSTTLGNALMEIQSFVNPSVRHRLEEQHRQHDEDEDQGDPPVAGDLTRSG